MHGAKTMPRPIGTNEDFADYLIQGFWTDYDGAAARRWADNTITFNVQGMNATQAAASRLAFAQWASVANLTFTEVTGVGDITLLTTANGSGARSNPDGLFLGFLTGSTIRIAADWNAGAFQLGDYGFETLIHEIGHSLGLGHLGPYDGGSIYDYDVSLWANATRQFSVMSYVESNAWDPGNVERVTTPQQADILAIQQLYGAPGSANADNSIYGSGAAGGVYDVLDRVGIETGRSFTIVDTGGYDFISMFGSNRVNVIELRPLLFSSLGGFTNNVSIWRGSVIEAALGGSVEDVITGAVAGNYLVGGGGNDELYGLGGADTLQGDDGADTLDGGSGADIIFAGAGNDVIWASRNDDVDAGDGDDRIRWNGNPTLTGEYDGGAGIDTLDPFAALTIPDAVVLTGIENLGLGPLAVTISAAKLNGFQRIVGTDGVTTGNLVISAAGFATVGVQNLSTVNVTGSTGNDTLAFSYLGGTTATINVTAGDGADVITGSDGNDSLNGGNGNDTLTGGLGNDTLIGGNDNDSLSGGDGNDYLTGDAGLDTYSGGVGNDTIFMAANEVVDAGDGDDRINVFNAAGNVGNFAGGFGIDTLDAAIIGTMTFGAAAVFTSIEQLALDDNTIVMAASDANTFNTLVASGTSTNGRLTLSSSGSLQVGVTGLASAVITGFSGNDSFEFNYGGPTNAALTVLGGLGNDVINSSGGSDSLDGGDGNDTLNGSLGPDTLTGGLGNDLLFVESFGDVANGGAGDDTVSVGSFVAGTTLTGGDGTDTLIHKAGDTAFFSSNTTIAGIENLALDLNAVTMNALQLNAFSQLVGQSGATTGKLTLVGGGGTASVGVQGLTVVDVTGSVGNDRLDFNYLAPTTASIIVSAGGGLDRIVGSNGNDTLSGGAQDDTLLGGGGNDSLRGGLGNDSLTGGAGFDRFAFDSGEGLGGGSDVVSDYVDNVDDLVFLNFGAAYDTAAEILAAASQQGADTRFTLGVTLVTLTNVNLALIDAGDIAFA